MGNAGIRLLAVLAGLGALCCAVTFGAFFGSLYASREDARFSYAIEPPAVREHRVTDEGRTDIAGLPRFAERAIANPRSQNSEERSERDLAAQEGMAVWAFWMAAAAIGTLAITSFGTLLIWRQVRMTRKAVKDTGDATKAMVRQNEISEHSQRP